MQRDLVVVCAGDQSLHPGFADRRNFDLWVIYFGDSDAVFDRYQRGADRVFRRRGLKWELIRGLSDLHLAGERSLFDAYSYVFLPDDDLAFPDGALDIQRLFEAAALTDADIGQPAIANEHFSWQATRQIPGALCHATNVVEIMAPVYSTRMLREFVLPGLAALDFLRAGWGLEAVIPKAAEVGLRRPVRSFVFDSVPMIHSRPPGSSITHRIGHDEALMMPGIFSDKMATHASFRSYESARAFRFPFIRDSTDQDAIRLSMRRINEMREIDRVFRGSRILRSAQQLRTLARRARGLMARRAR
jgi:hypothetical protein